MSKKLKQKIEEYGVHAQLGPYGKGWGIEQNPLELATFLSSFPEAKTVLEIGTGYRGGLARFLSEVMGFEVTTVDIKEYSAQTRIPGVEYVVSEDYVPAGKFDLVILDAAHTYELVKEHYERYRPYASQAIAIHDVAGYRGCEGAAQYWMEISRTKTGKIRKWFRETIADSEMAAGIGWELVK